MTTEDDDRAEGVWSRRAALVAGASGAAVLALALFPRREMVAQAVAPGNVSVMDFGAAGDGRHDDTAAFQRACDALAGGGVVSVPAGHYRIDRVVIRHRGLSIQCAEGVLLTKAGGAGLRSRGMFEINGLIDAGFDLEGATIDLNGEGPQDIGTPGRIPNRYGSLTVATVNGITGPPNAAVYALRSSGIAVRGCHIRNSGENGLLFRNCGGTRVEDCEFENLANWGIEYSFVAGDADGGSGPKPVIGDCSVTGSTFTDIDDLALGTGNGVGVGGGGGRNMGGFRNFAISDCSFVRCKGDIHFEFESGSWIEGLAVSHIRSVDARQGSLGLISVHDAVVDDYSITDPGSAPFALLIPQRPEVFGIALSSGFRNITLRNVSVRDTRSGRQIGASDASGVQGSTRLTTAAPHFAAGDVGQWIGVSGGNPGGTTYLGKVRAVVSSREIQLDHPLGHSVASAPFALGGVTRNGIIMTAGDDVVFDNVTVEAGSAADPASRAEAAAIRLYRVGGQVDLKRVSIKAPGARGTEKAVAIRVIQSNARLNGIENAAISGYAERSGNPR
jgi:hypothetical protein